MVQAGRFGRKAGRGYYDYSGRLLPAGRSRAARGGRRRGRRRGRGRRTARRRPARRRRPMRATRCSTSSRSTATRRDILIDAVTGRSPLEAEPTIDDPETLVLRPVCRRQPRRARHAGRSGRLSRAASAGRVAAGRVDALRRRRSERDVAPGRGVLPLPRQARRVGRRRPGPGAGPDRLPARQRGRFRGVGGSRLPRGRRRRDARRLQLSARTARVGGPDRARSRAVDARLALRGAEGGALPCGAAAAPDGCRRRDRRGDGARLFYVRPTRPPDATAAEGLVSRCRQTISSTRRRRTG